MKNHKTITIYGRVQGVGFRYYTKQKADLLGIRGFVKNKPDGSVYIEAEAGGDAMNEFLAFCRQGPPLARVINIEVSDTAPSDYKNFRIR